MARRTKDDQEQGVSRREMLKLGAGAAIGAPMIKIEQTRASRAPERPATGFFTPEELALVDEPFATFNEWDSEADRKAYATL